MGVLKGKLKQLGLGFFFFSFLAVAKNENVVRVDFAPGGRGSVHTCEIRVRPELNPVFKTSADEWYPPSNTALANFPQSLRDGPRVTDLIKYSPRFRRLALDFIYAMGSAEYRLEKDSTKIYMGVIRVLYNEGVPYLRSAAALGEFIASFGFKKSEDVEAWLKARWGDEDFSPVYSWVTADKEAFISVPDTYYDFSMHAQSSGDILRHDITRNLAPVIFPGEIYRDSFVNRMRTVDSALERANEAMLEMRQLTAQGVLNRDSLFAGVRSEEEALAATPDEMAHLIQYDDKNQLIDEVELQNARDGRELMMKRRSLVDYLRVFLDAYALIVENMDKIVVSRWTSVAEHDKVAEIARYRLEPLVKELGVIGINLPRAHKQLPVFRQFTDNAAELTARLKSYLTPASEVLIFSGPRPPSRSLLDR